MINVLFWSARRDLPNQTIRNQEFRNVFNFWPDVRAFPANFLRFTHITERLSSKSTIKWKISSSMFILDFVWNVSCLFYKFVSNFSTTDHRPKNREPPFGSDGKIVIGAFARLRSRNNSTASVNCSMQLQKRWQPYSESCERAKSYIENFSLWGAGADRSPIK